MESEESQQSCIVKIGSKKFSNFNFSTDRLDELFSTYMNADPYQKLFKVLQLLLVLSHGEASVERGFSVNKELEVENLETQSLVAQRLVCDHINAVGGILNVPIAQPLPLVLQQENVMKGTLNNKDSTRNLRKEVGKGGLC